MDFYFEDRFPENLKKAKLFFWIVLSSMAFAVLEVFYFRYCAGSQEHRDFLVGVTFFLAIIFAPISLLFVLRSYRKREARKWQKLFLLITLLFLNSLFLFSLVFVFKDIITKLIFV